jgi:hypothetical protein
MYEYPTFDVEIIRDVSRQRVYWPEAQTAQNDSGLGGNREYMDLRRLSWSEAIRVHRLEGDLIARVEEAAAPEDEYEKMEEEWCEDPPDNYGLDLGVASTVVALSAARCLPFSSCNAGAFGGRHHESYPLVAFCARPQTLGLLLECAVAAGIGLVIEETGELVAYATDVRQMRAFGNALISRRADFRAIRTSKARGLKSGKAAQQELFAPDYVSCDSRLQEDVETPKTFPAPGETSTRRTDR